MKIAIIFVLLCLLFAGQSRRSFRGTGNKGVGKAGSYLGNAVVNIVNFFRGKPTLMPKNYKRQYERPVPQEHTLAYKFKNGLTNLLYLGYTIFFIIACFGAWKLYKVIVIQYYRHQLSILPRNNEYIRIEKIIKEIQGGYSQSSPSRRVAAAN